MPKTAHVTDEKETNITVEALDAIKGKQASLYTLAIDASTNKSPEFISVNMPELAEIGVSSTKLCWYTDSIDNSFVVDFVPGKDRVLVCSGGSGHGFKFLPILGREVVKIIEAESKDGVYSQMWKWRDNDTKVKNGLEEGETGPRVLSNQNMASEADWAFAKA